MKYEDINENTIKITLSFDDLTDYDIKLSDFFGNQEVIEQFFYELVDELGLENRFGNVGMLTMLQGLGTQSAGLLHQMGIPHPRGRVD